MEPLRAVALTGLLVTCAVPAGAAVLRGCGFKGSDFANGPERWLLATASGLGLLALLYTLAGLGGLLAPVVVLALPLVLAAVALPIGRGLLGVKAAAPTGTSASHDPLWRAASGATGGALFVLALAVLVQDLAPPTDYDGLLYHLVAPQAFLAAQGIVYIPDNFSANLPALGEMLFVFGLAGGSDRAPQLLHGVAGGLACGLTYTFGARLFGPRPAAWGAAGLAATPLVSFLATRAYIDLFTVLFGLVALFGVVLYLGAREPAWLRLAGAGAGLALATKYSALTLVAVLGATLLTFAWKGGSAVRPGAAGRLRAALQAGGVFGATTGLVAAPWYARQALVLGNPVWPMYLGGRDWDATRVEQLTYFVAQYGTGHGWADWLLLPWNVYAHAWRFGHVPGAYPPVLALAAPLALLVPRSAGAASRWLLLIVAGAAVLWARGWQDLRFLLTIYPALALLGAAGVDAALGRVVEQGRWGGPVPEAGGRRAGRRRSWGRLARSWGAVAPGVVAMLVAALCLATAAWQVGRAWDTAGVVFGREPVDAFLGRRLPDFGAITKLNREVPAGRSALFLGGGQIWYCRPRCIPDPAHDNLLQWFVRPGAAGESLARLQHAGVSHILLSKVDFWYLEHQDPEDRLRRQLGHFYLFKADHLDLVYEDAWTEVYRGRW